MLTEELIFVLTKESTFISTEESVFVSAVFQGESAVLGGKGKRNPKFSMSISILLIGEDVEIN